MTKTMKRMAMLLMMLCMLFAVMSVAQAADEVACEHKDLKITIVKPGDCTKDVPQVWTESCECGYIVAKSEVKHDWKYAIRPADCDEPEYYGMQCTVCKKWHAESLTKVEGTEPLGHTYVPATGAKVVEATCTKTGSIDKAYCKVCDPKAEKIVPYTIPMKKHDYQPKNIPANCAEPAYTCKECSVCKSVIEKKAVEGSKPLTEDKLHSFDTVAGQAKSEKKVYAATCVKDGKWVYVCNKCGVESAWSEKIPADEKYHKLVTVEGSVLKVADCVTKVNGIEKQKCTNEDCKYETGWTYISYETAHDWDVVEETAPTCGKAGLKKSVCTICEEKKEEKPAATGKHDFEVVAQDANCTYAASVVEICTVCGAEGKREQLEGAGAKDENAHIWKLDEKTTGKDFKDNCDNCTGDYGYYKCSVCGDEKWMNLPHANKSEKKEFPADCLLPQRIELVCTECGKLIADDDYEVVKGGDKALTKNKDHTWSEWEAIVEPTCQTKGSRIRWCEVEGCNASELDEAWTDADAHVFDIEVLREATCEKNGIGLYTCTAEGCKFEPEYRVMKQKHDWVEVGEATNAAKPCVAGTVKVECSLCGEEGEEDVKATAKHNYQYGVIPATCKANEKFGEVCTMCGKGNGKLVETPNTKLDHKAKFVKWIEEPTCTVDGSFQAVCEYCNAKMDAQVAEAEGHKAATDYTEIKNKCLGNYLVKLCTVCKSEIEETKLVISTGEGHKGVPGTIAPTCSSEGFDCLYCSECKWIDPASITNKVPADKKTHTAKAVGEPLREATCYEMGISKQACAECDKDMGYGTIPMKEHKFSKTETYNAELKKMVKYCENAGCTAYTGARDPKPEEIPSEKPAECAHEMADVAAKAATCTEAGYKAYKACTKCDHTEGFEVIEATGHEKTTTYAFNADFTAKVATTVCANCDLKEIVETPLK